MSAEVRFDRTALMQRVRANTVVALGKAAVVVQAEIQKQLSKHGSGKYGAASPAGEPPGARTGALKRNIQIDDSDVNSKLQIRVGSNLPYARIQEVGGTITAKGKKLTVPIGEEGRRLAARAGGNLRSLNLKLMFGRGGRMFLGKRHGWDYRPTWRPGPAFWHRRVPRFIPVFALMDSVVLPPRPYMRPGLAAAHPKMLKAFDKIMVGVGR